MIRETSEIKQQDKEEEEDGAFTSDEDANKNNKMSAGQTELWVTLTLAPGASNKLQRRIQGKQD